MSCAKTHNMSITLLFFSKKKLIFHQCCCNISFPFQSSQCGSGQLQRVGTLPSRRLGRCGPRTCSSGDLHATSGVSAALPLPLSSRSSSTSRMPVHPQRGHPLWRQTGALAVVCLLHTGRRGPGTIVRGSLSAALGLATGN